VRRPIRLHVLDMKPRAAPARYLAINPMQVPAITHAMR